jgi:hypothetical protein
VYDHERPTSRSENGESQIQYADDTSFAQPTRHLTDWFLLFRRTPVNREALESFKDLATLPHVKNNFHFSARYELYGYLEPNNRTEHPPIRIVLRDLKVWSIDRSDATRGIRIHTHHAMYHLKSPRQTQLTVNEGVADLHEDALYSNMNHVHMPVRAMCGLVYNMLDIFGHGANQNYYTRYHTGKTPAQVYELLTPSEEQLEQYPDISKVPFHMALLRQCASFVREHILQCHRLVTAECPFVQGLDVMAAEYKDARKMKHRWAMETLNWEKIALEAEDRSGRDPSGKRREGAPPCNPNKVLDLEREGTENHSAAAADETSATTAVITSGVSATAAASTLDDDDDAADNEIGAPMDDNVDIPSLPNSKVSKQHHPKRRLPLSGRTSSSSSPSEKRNSITSVNIGDKGSRKPKSKHRFLDDDDDDEDEAGSGQASVAELDRKRPPIPFEDDSKPAADDEENLEAPFSKRPQAETFNQHDPPPILTVTLGDMAGPAAGPLEVTFVDMKSQQREQLKGTIQETLDKYIDETQKGIAATKGVDFILEIVNSSKPFLSLDVCVLCVEILARSTKAVRMLLFKTKSKFGIDEASVAGRCIFIRWLNKALVLLQEERGPKPRGQASITTVEEDVILGVMDLILAMNDILGFKNRVELLKAKFGIDWIDCAETSIAVARRLNYTRVRKKAEEVQEFLLNLKPEEPKKKKSTAAATSVAAAAGTAASALAVTDAIKAARAQTKSTTSASTSGAAVTATKKAAAASPKPKKKKMLMADLMAKARLNAKLAAPVAEAGSTAEQDSIYADTSKKLYVDSRKLPSSPPGHSSSWKSSSAGASPGGGWNSASKTSASSEGGSGWGKASPKQGGESPAGSGWGAKKDQSGMSSGGGWKSASSAEAGSGSGWKSSSENLSASGWGSAANKEKLSSWGSTSSSPAKASGSEAAKASSPATSGWGSAANKERTSSWGSAANKERSSSWGSAANKEKTSSWDSSSKPADGASGESGKDDSQSNNKGGWGVDKPASSWGASSSNDDGLKLAASREASKTNQEKPASDWGGGGSSTDKPKSSLGASSTNNSSGGGWGKATSNDDIYSAATASNALSGNGDKAVAGEKSNGWGAARPASSGGWGGSSGSAKPVSSSMGDSNASAKQSGGWGGGASSAPASLAPPSDSMGRGRGRGRGRGLSNKPAWMTQGQQPAGSSSVSGTNTSATAVERDVATKPAQQPAASTTTPAAAPTRAEPVRQAPAPIRAEPVRQAPIRAEPVRQAPIRAEPVRQAPAPIRAEPVRQAPAPIRAEPVRQAPAPIRAEPVRQAPVRAGRGRGLSNKPAWMTQKEQQQGLGASTVTGAPITSTSPSQNVKASGPEPIAAKYAPPTSSVNTDRRPNGTVPVGRGRGVSNQPAWMTKGAAGACASSQAGPSGTGESGVRRDPYDAPADRDAKRRRTEDGRDNRDRSHSSSRGGGRDDRHGDHRDRGGRHVEGDRSGASDRPPVPQATGRGYDTSTRGYQK